MFTEILKFKTILDNNSLNSMINSLSKRFATVAKKFGSGLAGAIKGGGVLAIAGVLIDKVLNPLKETQQVLENLLNTGDDTVTNAAEFGTSEGNLIKLQALGKANGLDAETLRQLLTKFQSALAEESVAAKDPASTPGLLRDFVGEKDTAQAFFQFVQSLQKVDDNLKVLAQNEIFGEKIRGRASEFFNQEDFGGQLNKLNLPATDVLTSSAKKVGALSDTNDLLAAAREVKDFVAKAKLAEESQIVAIDRAEQIRLKQEQERLTTFETQRQISDTVTKISNVLENGFLRVTSQLPQVQLALQGINSALNFVQKNLSVVSDALKKISDSKFMRYFTGK